MLHAWSLVALAMCAVLASLSLLRGVAGLIVASGMLARMEGVALTVAGLAGWIGTVLVYLRPT